MSEGQKGFMKKKMYLIIQTLVFVSITLSCERDDICAEGTPTTPQLIIRFNNLSEQDQSKNVTSLKISGINDLGEELVLTDFNVVTTDSIVLPLRTNTNSTRFKLHKDFAIDDNGTPEDTSDDFETGNPDFITITYTTEQIYVSRACGFKTIFNDLDIDIEIDSDNWMSQQFTILATNNTVKDEAAAHITIFH
jgi:hypothetical protein